MNWTTFGCKHPRELDKVMEVVRRMLYGPHLVCFETMSKEVHWVRLLVRKVVSWTALISEYAEYVYVEEVQYMMNQESSKLFWKYATLTLAKQMQNDGFPLDVIIFVSLLKACGSVGVVDRHRKS